MKISTTHRVQSTGSRITLGELEEFVAHCKAAGAAGNTVVNIDKFNGDQRDPGYCTITATIDHG